MKKEILLLILLIFTALLSFNFKENDERPNYKNKKKIIKNNLATKTINIHSIVLI